MIRHVLLFKFNEGVNQDQQLDAVERLQQLGEECPTIDAWSVGTNFAESPSAYDVIEIGDFSSVEALEEYKAHPAHIAFSDFIRPLATWALVDCEVEGTPKPKTHKDAISLSEVVQIPPVSLVLGGAKYDGLRRGNREYYELRKGLSETLGDDLSISQLGRSLVRLVQGRLPKDLFTYTPLQGLTYNARISNMDELRRFRAVVGAESANRILGIFDKLATQTTFKKEK